MRAAVVHGEGDIRIEEYTTPSAGQGEVIVRTKMCGICATDIKTLLGQGLPKDLPTILGHEVVGEIADTGEGVTGFGVGDRVSVYPIAVCGDCYFCRRGRNSLCENEFGLAHGIEGGFAECRQWDLPLLGVIGLGKVNEDKKKDPQFIGLGARVGAEHGADIIKTYYTETGFDKVVAGCPVPVMIAGGPKCETDLDTLKMIHGALQGVARGIVMGRNVWQSPHPTALLSAVYGLIHENMSVKEAADLLEQKIAE